MIVREPLELDMIVAPINLLLTENVINVSTNNYLVAIKLICSASAIHHAQLFNDCVLSAYGISLPLASQVKSRLKSYEFSQYVYIYRSLASEKTTYLKKFGSASEVFCQNLTMFTKRLQQHQMVITTKADTETETMPTWN